MLIDLLLLQMHLHVKGACNLNMELLDSARSQFLWCALYRFVRRTLPCDVCYTQSDVYEEY
jgi:hypothetical protein